MGLGLGLHPKGGHGVGRLNVGEGVAGNGESVGAGDGNGVGALDGLGVGTIVGLGEGLGEGLAVVGAGDGFAVGANVGKALVNLGNLIVAIFAPLGTLISRDSDAPSSPWIGTGARYVAPKLVVAATTLPSHKMSDTQTALLFPVSCATYQAFTSVGAFSDEARSVSGNARLSPRMPTKTSPGLTEMKTLALLLLIAASLELTTFAVKLATYCFAGMRLKAASKRVEGSFWETGATATASLTKERIVHE